MLKPNEWIGTRLIFRITDDTGDRARLMFKHLGLTPSLECWDICNNGRNYFIKSLRQYMATRRGMPCPLG